MTELTIPTRVLIVEDDPNIVDLIRSNLAVRGFDTCVSGDGSKALALLDTQVLVPGHGDLWRGPIREATNQATALAQ